MSLVDISEVQMGVVGFDYASLPRDVADAARSTAERIRSRLSSSVIETGRDLLTIKERLGHGNFLAWIEAEFGMNERSAQRYMNSANMLGKYDTVSHLPPTTIYALSAKSTPDDVREAVISRLESGETVTPKEINDRIDQAKEERTRAERLARMKPEERKRVQARERRQLHEKSAFEREMEAERAQRETRRNNAAAAVEYLRDALGAHFEEFRQLFSDCDVGTFVDLLKRDGDPS